MKRQKYLLIASCCLLAILAGCSYWIEIIVTGDDPFHPEFVLKKHTITAPIRKTAQLDYFSICDVGWSSGYRCQDTMWNFWLSQDQVKYVGRVQYGIVPDGFEEEAPSKPLTAGVTYLVEVGGAGGSGSVRFQILEKDGSYELKVLENEESGSESSDSNTDEGQ